MSSSSPKGKLSASENGSPGMLGPARSEMSDGDAESVSPRSSVSSEQSLTTQLLLGDRPNLFNKTPMSAGSPDACLAASPDRASNGLETVRSHKSSPDQPAALDEALHTHVDNARNQAQSHAASAGISPTLLQQDREHQDPSCYQPDSRQQSRSNVTLHTSSASEHLRPPSTSESANSSTLLVNNSALLSLPSQLRSLREPSATSSPQGGTVVADSIHSSTGSPPVALEASTDPNAQQPQLLHCVMSTPMSLAIHASEEFSGTTSSANPTHAELEAKASSELAESSNFQEGHHTQFETGLLSEPSGGSEPDTVTSESASRSHGSEPDAVILESVSRSADDFMASEPANGSADAVTVSEPASSQPDDMVSKFGSQISHHAPHATSVADLASPTVDSPSQKLPTLRLSQRPVPAQDDSRETSEAGAGTDAVPGPSTAGSDSPHTEQLEVAVGIDAVPGPGTAGSVSPHTEQLEAAIKLDAVPGPSSLHHNSPQAERQSSSATASTSGVDEAAPDMSTSAQRLQAQTDGQGGVSAAWKQHRKHVFILSNAGKPIWTLHGDENALAGLMAVVQALVSFVHDKGDAIRSIRSGQHLIVFLEKGPFILVMASATNEPESALLGQLGLVHGQILSILTNSVEKMFARNPSYDVRKLLGATNHVLMSLVASFEHDPSAMLTSLVPLPLRSNLRHYALVFLQRAVKSAGALFGVLLTQTAIVAVAQSRAHVMHPHDLLLLANLVRSNESFRQAETFTPICLPHFNPTAFLHAYVQYLHVSSGFCLVLLSSHAESFFRLAEAAKQIQLQLKQPGVSQAVISTVENQAGGGLLSIADLPSHCGGGQVGTTPLLHFLYKSPMRAQVIMPAFAPPLDTPELQQGAMQRYAVVQAAMFSRHRRPGSSRQGSLPHNPSSQSLPAPPLQQQVHWCTDGSLATLAYGGPEYELYALFDSMTDKPSATQICQRLSVWIKSQQAELFMQR